MMKFNVAEFLKKQGINPGETAEIFINNYWQPRQESEKKVLILAGFLIAFASYFWGVWQPLNHKIAQQQLNRQQLAHLQIKLES